MRYTLAPGSIPGISTIRLGLRQAQASLMVLAPPVLGPLFSINAEANDPVYHELVEWSVAPQREVEGPYIIVNYALVCLHRASENWPILRRYHNQSSRED